MNTNNKNVTKNRLKSKSDSKKRLKTFSFLQTKEFKITLGIFLFLFSILLFVSFISYIKTWESDDQLFDYGFWDIIKDTNKISHNISGKIGAWLGYIFIKKWFGISSLYSFI